MAIVEKQYAGVRERDDANRARVAGNRDEVEGVLANTLSLFRNGAASFIDWLDRPSHEKRAKGCMPEM